MRLQKNSSTNKRYWKFCKSACYVPDFPPEILSGWGKGTESRKPNPEPPPRMGIEKKREIPEWTPGKTEVIKVVKTKSFEE